MSRRTFGLGLVFGCALASLSGCCGSKLCPSGRVSQQAQMMEPAAALGGNAETAPTDADPTEVARKETQGFFKPTRRSGAWSSEGAAIEADLGVPR